MSGAVLGAFVVGIVTGSVLTWSAARSSERVRRIRRDLKAARNGLKTLRKMLRREGAALVRVALVVALVVVVAVVLAR